MAENNDGSSLVGVRGDFKILSTSSLEAAAEGKQVDVL
jgi:hypothetical protein